ncbi:hypothetical protein H9P43_006677 [Blastocladiella emersonii ATCC 22665]|nr:hypothetical protein H9P43_006677 [Blastocladiella emersonii ATCC 22665]
MESGVDAPGLARCRALLARLAEHCGSPPGEDMIFPVGDGRFVTLESVLRIASDTLHVTHFSSAIIHLLLRDAKNRCGRELSKFLFAPLRTVRDAFGSAPWDGTIARAAGKVLRAWLADNLVDTNEFPPHAARVSLRVFPAIGEHSGVCDYVENGGAEFFYSLPKIIAKAEAIHNVLHPRREGQTNLAYLGLAPLCKDGAHAPLPPSFRLELVLRLLPFLARSARDKITVSSALELDINSLLGLASFPNKRWRRMQMDGGWAADKLAPIFTSAQEKPPSSQKRTFDPRPYFHLRPPEKRSKPSQRPIEYISLVSSDDDDEPPAIKFQPEPEPEPEPDPVPEPEPVVVPAIQELNHGTCIELVVPPAANGTIAAPPPDNLLLVHHLIASCHSNADLGSARAWRNPDHESVFVYHQTPARQTHLLRVMPLEGDVPWEDAVAMMQVVQAARPSTAKSAPPRRSHSSRDAQATPAPAGGSSQLALPPTPASPVPASVADIRGGNLDPVVKPMLPDIIRLLGLDTFGEQASSSLTVSMALNLAVLRAAESMLASDDAVRDLKRFLARLADSANVDVSRALCRPCTIDEYKSMWASASAAPGPNLTHPLSSTIRVFRSISQAQRLIVVVACIVDNLAAALGTAHIDVPANADRLHLMIAVDRLAKDDWEWCLEWFARTVAPTADLRELGLGIAPVKKGVRKLRAALEAHPLDPFIQLLAPVSLAAAYPSLAPHSVNTRARHESSRAATVIALTDPAFRDPVIARVQEIANADGLVPTVRAYLVFAAACVTSPAVLVPSPTRFDGRPAYALAHADSPVGITVPAYRAPLASPASAGHAQWRVADAERAQPRGVWRRTQIGKILWKREDAQAPAALVGWDEFKRTHKAALDVLARAAKR